MNNALASLKMTTVLQLCSLVLLAACSAKVSGPSDAGIPNFTPASTPAPVVATADCDGRHADNIAIGNQIQAQLDAVSARPGTGSTVALRQSISAFAKKYAGLTCDNQTTESVVGQMNSAADMIDHM